jgi:hypothetical protein
VLTPRPIAERSPASAPRRSAAIAALGLAALLATAGCSGATSLDTFDDQCPPPDLGRPWWVRYPARLGAYVGGVVGAVTSVVLLPITYPVSLLGSDAFGSNKTDFMLFPAYMLAGAGHFVLGAPLDTVHYVAWRAWVEPPPRPSYDSVPPPRADSRPAPESRPSAESAPSAK